MTVRLIKHETVPGTGSFEVRFADGRRSVYFYFDDLPSRRLRPEQMLREQALHSATMFARIMRGLIEGWTEGSIPQREPLLLLNRDSVLIPYLWGQRGRS